MKTLPEWTDLRFFLELARSGTLSGASRRLEVEHTTVAPYRPPGAATGRHTVRPLA